MSRKLWVCEHVTNCGKVAHVEVSTDAVNFVLRHVCVLPSEQISGGTAFSGHNIVDVDSKK